MDDVLEEPRNEMKVVLLIRNGGCHFRTEDHLCSIYPTRPNVCVAIQAGDEQCQDSRWAGGLPALRPLPDDA